MRVEIGNLKSKLITDNPKLITALSDKYAFRVPGYQYTPAYKKKHWDGKKRYFNSRGEFRTGIWPRIREDLLRLTSDFEVVIDIKEEETPKLKTVEGFNYFDYQEEAIQHILDTRRAVIQSPVGSGKTLIMAGLIKSLAPRKMVVMFREKGILTQTYEFFKKCGIESLGINFGEGYIYGDVMLTTVQSIEKILDSHLDDSEVLIIDEAHQFCKGETTVAAIEAFPNAVYRAAFTATPPQEKSDIHGRLTLEGAFGPVYSTISAEDLVADGILAKPIIQILEYAPSGCFEDLDYRTIYQQMIVESEERNAKIKTIVDHVRKNNETSKTLILCKDLKHVNILSNMLSNVYVIDGSIPVAERYELIKKFIEDKNHPIIIGTNVMQTGININEITHMINARGLEGEIPTIQGLGRGLRVTKGKTVLHFYDFFDKVPYLKEHSKKRIKHYEELNFEVTYVRL